MSKRFTDTDKYKKPFIRSLPGAYKLFWDYLYHECDHAGIWIVDFEISQIYLGADMQVDKKTALDLFNKDETRVIEFSGGKKWFIIPFIEFQYGELNPDNRVHKSVINILKKENLYNENKGLVRGLCAPKDKDKDKDKEKDKDIDYVEFLNFWNDVNDCNLRITESKRKHIRARLKTFSKDEIMESIKNRAKDDWINGEGKKYKPEWKAFWRNDEKVERYLNSKSNGVMDGGTW